MAVFLTQRLDANVKVNMMMGEETETMTSQQSNDQLPYRSLP